MQRIKSFYQLRCFYPLGKLILFVKVFGHQNLSDCILQANYFDLNQFALILSLSRNNSSE
jgi:hypothetical protein